MSRKQEQEVLVCRDCRHAEAVTTEYPDSNGEPIFCTCPFSRYYNFLNHNVTHKNCIYHEPKEWPQVKTD